MEKNSEVCRAQDQDFLLPWGNRKRMRCVKVQMRSGVDVKIKRTTFRVVRADDSQAPQIKPPPKPNCTQTPNRTFNKSLKSPPAAEAVRVQINNNDSGHSSPEKSERIHTRGFYYNNNVCSSTEEANKTSREVETMREKKSSNLEVFVWPKFEIALTSKEKEEDFMAMKGSKLPQRPKKRAKFIQRNLLFVSPGSWLCELSQERYEVREKKNTKKISQLPDFLGHRSLNYMTFSICWLMQRRRGLKAMKNLDSDSD